MMKNNLFFVVVSLFLACCAKNKSSIINSSNDSLSLESSQKDTTLVSNYYRNGILKEKGREVGGNKIGKWSYYLEENKLDKVFEYIVINNNQYTNQGWYFNKEGDTIHDLGNHYNYEFSPKEHYSGEIFMLKLKYKPIVASNSDVIAFLSTDVKYDFSNLNNVPYDTIHFDNFESNVTFEFENPGDYFLRGYIKEFIYKVPTIENPTDYEERIMYVNIPLKIKSR